MADPAQATLAGALHNNAAVRDVVFLCPPGFEEVVSDAAVRELPRCLESSRSYGLVRVHTDASDRELRAFPCATNAFAVIAEVPRADVDGEAKSLAERLTAGRRDAGDSPRPLRLRIQDDGRLAPTTSQAADALEAALRSSSLIDGAARAVEVWLIRRYKMRSSLLAKRLSAGTPRPKRGELRPEVCAALARVEPLAGAELVMDPFAGSGAIGDACLAAGAKSVWLNDVAVRSVRPFQRPATKWTTTDFRRLRVRTGSVDAIVTDPPWDRSWKIRRGAGHLYADFGTAAGEWLRPGGALVLLTGAPDAAVELMLEAGKLRIEVAQAVLVNGSRATVVRARRGRRSRHR